MSIHPLAGKHAPAAQLANIPRLISAYYTLEAGAPVAFGTSGHRGSSLFHSFNEGHILAVTEAICRYRAEQGTDGPLFIGMDTHALSEPAFRGALEVLGANGVEVMIDADCGYTPTPAVSLAILTYNQGRTRGLADGIVITPSHNPPEDGGIKYNPPHGGPAGSNATQWIERQANAFIAGGNNEVKRVSLEQALALPTTHRYDYVAAYIEGLDSVIDFDVIRSANPALGVAPLGGAGVAYWGRIGERYGIDLTIVDDTVDPTFRFMTLDWDGKIRMDCSSPYAMASLIAMKDRFDVAFACDTDHDRHGIVTRSSGLMNPNHYLAVAIEYLFSHRSGWQAGAGVGKTLVSSSMIDRVAAGLGRKLVEVPVGFKFFVDGLLDGSLGFGGEESAGASFLRKDGTVWTTDKDGLILGLLSAEILSRHGRDPGEMYRELTRRYGDPVYERVDAPATPEQKSKLAKLSANEVHASELAGEKIESILTEAPNGAGLGGLKVMTANGWFAARPSGTENVYKIYAESFIGAGHLRRVQEEAKALVAMVI